MLDVDHDAPPLCATGVSLPKGTEMQTPRVHRPVALRLFDLRSGHAALYVAEFDAEDIFPEQIKLAPLDAARLRSGDHARDTEALSEYCRKVYVRINARKSLIVRSRLAVIRTNAE